MPAPRRAFAPVHRRPPTAPGRGCGELPRTRGRSGGGDPVRHRRGSLPTTTETCFSSGSRSVPGISTSVLAHRTPTGHRDIKKAQRGSDRPISKDRGALPSGPELPRAQRPKSRPGRPGKRGAAGRPGRSPEPPGALGRRSEAACPRRGSAADRKRPCTCMIPDSPADTGNPGVSATFSSVVNAHLPAGPDGGPDERSLIHVPRAAPPRTGRPARPVSRIRPRPRAGPLRG